jgi:hypothetical protein
MLNEAMSNQLLSFFIGFMSQQIFIIEDKTLNNIEKLSKSEYVKTTFYFMESSIFDLYNMSYP